MNGVLREALADNAITAMTAPERIRIRLDWLLAYLDEEPDLGMKFAIGTIRPVVYEIYQSEGRGPKRKVPRDYVFGEDRLAEFYIAKVVLS